MHITSLGVGAWAMGGGGWAFAWGPQDDNQSIAAIQAALDAGVPETAPVLTGIGYAEALAHIGGELTLDELPLAMARSNRRYARRQLRWWRRDERVRWFEIEPNPLPAILKYVKEPV